METYTEREKARAMARARRRKVVALERTALVAVLTVTLLAGLAISASAKAVDDSVATREIVVQPGESLWTIAAESDPARPVPATVRLIKRLNDMADSDLTAGQTLLVPAAR